MAMSMIMTKKHPPGSERNKKKQDKKNKACRQYKCKEPWMKTSHEA